MWRRTRLSLRLGLLLLLALPLLLALLQVYHGLRGHPESYAGLPRASALRPWPWATHWFHVIDPPGFVLGYSERWRNPLWVAYRLDDPRDGPLGRRPDGFEVDHRTLVRVDHADYSGSGYNRGHMAPNYAMARFHGRPAQLASFRMSNIVPQRSALNQKLWQRLEEIETDVYAAPPGPLWVVTGPLFGASPDRLSSGVAVPEAFYRIWLREGRDGRPEALAFMVPMQVTGYEPLDRFLVTVDAVEAASGLDFFHQLPDGVEDALEASLAPREWRFARHARRPPRY